MFVCCECCVLSGRGLCDELITRPEESYRLWRVVVCDQENSRISRLKPARAVFLNCRSAARYRALASIIPGRERPEETTICYKISLVQLITNLNVILYLSTCHAVYISVLILFMIMP